MPEVAIPLHLKLMVGGAAGLVGTTAVFPVDVVKTRLQASSGENKCAELHPTEVSKPRRIWHWHMLLSPRNAISFSLFACYLYILPIHRYGDFKHYP